MVKTKNQKIARVQRRESEKTVKIFVINYLLKTVYKHIKEPKLNIEKTNIKIILPMKYKKMEESIVLKIAMDKMYEAIAKKELENIMEKVRITLKFAPDEYEIARMNKTLGKCLDDKIIINPDIVMYKRETIEYIIFHEFCHLKFKKHTKKFYDMLKKHIPNYENCAYELIGLQY